MRLVLALKALEVDKDEVLTGDRVVDQDELVDEDQVVTGDRAVTTDQAVGTASGRPCSYIVKSLQRPDLSHRIARTRLADVQGSKDARNG